MNQAAESSALSREVFLALAAIGWADGDLDKNEADAIVRIALESGLELDEIEQIEEAAKKPIQLDTLDLSKLSLAERVFTYGAAAWLTRLDGQVSLDERAALHTLGTGLNLSKTQQQEINAITQVVANLSDDERPARYDLQRLRLLIIERFAS